MTRRPRDGAPAVNITFRAYPEDREAWEALAEADSALSLSMWIAKMLNAEVTRRQGKRSKP